MSHMGLGPLNCDISTLPAVNLILVLVKTTGLKPI